MPATEINPVEWFIPLGSLYEELGEKDVQLIWEIPYARCVSAKYPVNGKKQ